MIYWDVNNGLARRSWARNPRARYSIERAIASEPRLQVTLPYETSDDVIAKALYKNK